MNKVDSVYLAGFISTECPESLAWRLRVAPKLEEMGIKVLTPLHGKKQLFKSTPDGGITSTAANSKSIVLRDRMDVMKSGLILAHLETFGSSRGLLGTISELTWAFDNHKPVVAIAKADNYLMRRHPFMVEFVSEYFETEDEAIAFIKRYYGPGE